jgi:1,4-alpha-glucan branching enzyme
LTEEVLQQEAIEPETVNPPAVTVAPPVRHDDILIEQTGPVLTADGMVFTLDAPNAQRVQLVGDFNGWMVEGSDMERTGGVWKKVVKMPAGRYQYRFLVDGGWQQDPANVSGEQNPFGGRNSVVVLDVPPSEVLWN